MLTRHVNMVYWGYELKKRERESSNGDDNIHNNNGNNK